MSSASGKFMVLLVACVVGLCSYLYWAKTRIANPPAPAPQAAAPQQPVKAEAVAAPTPEPAPKAAPTPVPSTSEPEPNAAKTSAAKQSGPKQIFYRYTATDSNFGKVAIAAYPDVRSIRFAGDLSCQVVHFAAGVGVCMTADSSVLPKYGADVFDSSYKRRFHFDLAGIPSRCRVSPDGKLAAWTVFVTGHSYAAVDFSTQTLLVDTVKGQVLGDLEKFPVTKDGQPFQAPDFNFWGVTFTPDSKSFYCTLSSNRKHYLVKGDVRSRALSVIRENVECPSVSPDGMRIAYKKRNVVVGRPSWVPPPQMVWKLHVLELATMQETPLAEIRSVDDQLAWLDNTRVLYALPANQIDVGSGTNVWVTPADGSAPPELFLTAAYSPAVVW